MKHIILTGLTLLIASCSILNKDSQVRKSPVSQNNANDVFAPHVVDGKTVDKMHLQTQADYHFALAESHSLSGDTQKAIESFKMTLVYDPNSSMVRSRLAGEYLKSGLVNEAIEESLEAIKLNQDLQEPRVLLGGIYTSLKMYKEAEEQYRILLDTYPDEHENYIYLGALLAEQGKFESSIDVFDELLKVGSDDHGYLSHYYKARIYIEKGGAKNEKKALRELERTLEKNPTFIEAVVQMARIHQSRGKTEKVISLFLSYQDRQGPTKEGASFLSQYYLETNQYEKALEQLHYIEGFQPSDIEIKTKIALINMEMKNYKVAAEKFGAILDIDPTLDKIRFYLAAVFEEVKMYDDAIENFKMISVASDYFIDGTIHAALILKDRKEFEKSMALLSRAIQKRKDRYELYSVKATLLSEEDHHDRALTVLTEAVKLFSGNTEVLYLYGTSLDRAGYRAKMIHNMEKIIAIDSNHIQALNYLAYSYAETGEFLDEALRLAQKAIHLKPGDPYILDTIGWIFYKKGDMSQAIRFLEKSHSIKKDISIVAEHLADAYFKSQLPKKAKKMYEIALRLDVDEVKAAVIESKLISVKKQLQIPKRLPASK